MTNLQLCWMIDLYVVYVRDFVSSDNINGTKKKQKVKKEKSTQLNKLKCKWFYCLGSTLVERDWSIIEYYKLK